MREGWEYKKLGEVCDILDSKRKPITKAKRVSGSFPYYGATGLLDYVNNYIFDEQLVLLGEDGAKWGAGEQSAYKISGKTWVNNHAHVLRPKRDILLDDWLVYSLNYANLDDYITGVTVPKLNQEKMRTIVIAIPPIDEQHRIVSFLDSEFSKIDTLKANAERALQNAKDLFQATLKEAMTPKEGWEKKELGEVAKLCGGKRVPKGYKLEKETTNHPYIRVADFMDEGTVDLSDIHYISDAVYEQIKRYTITDEDVYISIAGTIGKSGIIPAVLNGANLTENACKLVLDEKLDKHFIYFFTISPLFKSQISKLTMVSAQPKLALTRLSTVRIAFPSIIEQRFIAGKIRDIHKQIVYLQSNYTRILSECQNLKQSLLKQVFE